MTEENIQNAQAAKLLAGPPAEAVPKTKTRPANNHAAKENATSQPNRKDIIGVRNQTNQRLTLKFELNQNHFQEVIFAPLQKRSLYAADPVHIDAYRELDRRGLILLHRKDQPEQFRSVENNIGLFEGFFPILLVFFMIGGYLDQVFPGYGVYFWIFVLVAFVVLVLLLWWLTKTYGWTSVHRAAAQSLTLLMVMAVGFGLTTTTIYFFGDGLTLIRSGPSLALLARILQLNFICIAALLPALLYYLFDRQQLGTLRERFEHQIFNLDPVVETLGDVQAKYGNQLDELYGRDATTSQGRLVPGTRWPILVCTLVITAGWIMTLQPIGTGLTIQTPSAMLALFFPQPALLTIGFLGTYYFALNMIVRRYTRGDLQPKAYSHIAVRIFIVTISAWVIEMVFGANTYTRLLIFIIGIVPETFITALQEIFRSNRIVAWALPQWQEKHPLTGLEGIDLYDRSRLAEEGVTNVEGLAHHDLIDLILATRIPIPRLVDWVDQAILYLHISENSHVDENSGQISKTMHRLREYGIRNATGLENALLEPTREKAAALIKHVEDSEERPARIEIIYTAMKDDDWLDYIRHWRKPKEIQAKTVTIKPNGVVSG